MRVVEIEALTDASLNPAALASMLGLNVQSAVSKESVARLLRDKRILLILDSGEHAIAVAARVADR